MAESPGRSASRQAAGRWPGPAVIFALAAVAAVAADLATPLFAATPWVGAALFCLAVALALASFRSSAKGFEARIAALVLPLALCGWAVFQLKEKPPGAPTPGVVAGAWPPAEALQAAVLPLGAEARAGLRLEAALKAGPDAAREAAIAGIARQPSVPLQKSLYQTAARFGDADQKQRVVSALMARRAGRPLPLELRAEDNLTMASQYLDGASIRFERPGGAGLAVRAGLTTNKETVALVGTLAGSDIALSGTASLADKAAPLTLTAGLTADLELSGVVRIGQGAGTPFTIPLWETGRAAPQSADETPPED